MKTTAELKKTIQGLLEVDTSEWTDGKIARHKKQIELNKTCLLYLEQNPREDFIKQEKERLEKKVEAIQNGYDVYESFSLASKYNYDEGKCRSDYNKETGLSGYKKHLDNINYLLT